jgi:hypothetical protein
MAWDYYKQIKNVDIIQLYKNWLLEIFFLSLLWYLKKHKYEIKIHGSLFSDLLNVDI